MSEPSKKSRIWMLISLVAVVALPIVVVFVIVMTNRVQPESSDDNPSNFTTPVATKEQTLGDIKNLDSSVDKVKADTAAAKSIISKSKNHTKLSD